jgi:DNA-binding MarR family transcriptional regulator
LLTILGDAVSRQVVEALDGTGLRHGHGYLVQRLLVAPATATEMAAELGITQQAVSKTIKELVALGHVEMTTDPADSRRRPARLTRRGRAAVTRARAARQHMDDRIREALGIRRFDRLVADLDQVLDALGLRDDVNRRTVKPPTDALS